MFTVIKMTTNRCGIRKSYAAFMVLCAGLKSATSFTNVHTLCTLQTANRVYKTRHLARERPADSELAGWPLNRQIFVDPWTRFAVGFSTRLGARRWPGSQWWMKGGTEARSYHTVPYVLWPPEGHRRGNRECLSGIFIILEDLPLVHYDPLDRQIVWMVGHHSSGATAISDPHRLSEGRNSWDIASPRSSRHYHIEWIVAPEKEDDHFLGFNAEIVIRGADPSEAKELRIWDSVPSGYTVRGMVVEVSM